MENYLEVLKNEFNAEDGSFLILLRCGMSWDKTAFIHRVTAMEECCKDIVSEEKVERWLADGFWYVQWFAESWSSHPEFPKRLSAEYYRLAYLLLFDLASYFFTGAHPRIDERSLVEVFLENTEIQNRNLFELE